MNHLNRIMVIRLSAIVSLLLLGQSVSAREFKSEADEMLYFWGTQLAEQLEAAGVSSKQNLESFRQGMQDRFEDKAPEFGAEYPSLLNNYLVAQKNQAIDAEKAASEKFLESFIEENEDVLQTESGLLYVELSEGTGEHPLKSSRIKAHYTGTLHDGTVFDSSIERGQPMTTRLTQVIGCWKEGIQLMKVGGKAKLLCPADTAYGNRGTKDIPGGATLLFEIELLEIVDGCRPAGPHPHFNMRN